jgi:hypothetical protein
VLRQLVYFVFAALFSVHVNLPLSAILKLEVEAVGFSRTKLRITELDQSDIH